MMQQIMMLLKRLYDQLAKKAVINYSKFVSKTDYDAKIKDIDDKIPSITNLATTTALISFENKIPNVSNLFKKKKKKIMMQKYHKLSKNILLLLIMNLLMIYWMQR